MSCSGCRYFEYGEGGYTVCRWDGEPVGEEDTCHKHKKAVTKGDENAD